MLLGQVFDTSPGVARIHLSKPVACCDCAAQLTLINIDLGGQLDWLLLIFFIYFCL